MRILLVWKRMLQRRARSQSRAEYCLRIADLESLESRLNLSSVASAELVEPDEIDKPEQAESHDTQEHNSGDIRELTVSESDVAAIEVADAFFAQEIEDSSDDIITEGQELSFDEQRVETTDHIEESSSLEDSGVELAHDDETESKPFENFVVALPTPSGTSLAEVEHPVTFSAAETSGTNGDGDDGFSGINLPDELAMGSFGSADEPDGELLELIQDEDNALGEVADSITSSALEMPQSSSNGSSPSIESSQSPESVATTADDTSADSQSSESSESVSSPPPLASSSADNTSESLVTPTHVAGEATAPQPDQGAVASTAVRGPTDSTNAATSEATTQSSATTSRSAPTSAPTKVAADDDSDDAQDDQFADDGDDEPASPKPTDIDHLFAKCQLELLDGTSLHGVMVYQRVNHQTAGIGGVLIDSIDDASGSLSYSQWAALFGAISLAAGSVVKWPDIENRRAFVPQWHRRAAHAKPPLPC